MADDLPEKTEAADPPAPPPGATFPVVGIGASAGGLEALQQLFKALPVDTGMAFVVVQHLAPDHASSLADILARVTAIPVGAVGEETAVERNRVYVLPPGRDILLAGGRLKLIEQQQAGLHGIDRFFRSLAEDAAHLAVGVVLSGGLNDGTVGLVEIKAAGGVTFAQDESAQHESMPKSAVAAGCVDFVLPPEGIAQELARIAAHPYVAGEKEAAPDGQPGHARVAEIVRRATGVDFTHYKANTLHRRITRRMMLHRLTTPTDYEEHLRRTPAEVEELYQDILIGVTSFFRNPDAFEALARDVFPKLIAACAPGEPVRCWVVGCSSGEEAYSLGIIFTECAEAAGSAAPLQLFATDVNQRCVEKARAGWYPRSIAQDVSPERLRQFFTEEGGGYRIRKALRERCVFSRHNALADPPFLRMDFLSCRNLLIYLEPVLQQHVVPLFHYALKPGGWLWLGSSESVGTVRDLFDTTDARHKIHARRPGGRTPGTRVQPTFSSLAMHEPANSRQAAHGGLPRDAERLLLAKYAPPGVVVSAGLEIVQFQGDTGPYLAPAAGAASLHLLKMLREGLPNPVRDALQRAEQSGAAERVENLRVRSNGGFRTLAVEVIPVRPGAAGKGGGFVVLFDDAGRPAPQRALGSPVAKWWRKLRGAGDATAPGLQTEEILHLTQELASTRETLQASIEQHEAANEELQSANEEAQSANEEMQSIYEELENSKEEIEASNKELTALNEELALRNADLSRTTEELRGARDYAESVVAHAPVPLVLLDGGLHVMSANRAFYDGFRVVPGETEGRLIYDLGNRQWDIPALRRLLEEILPDAQIITDYEVRHTFEGIGPRIMLLNASRLPQGAEAAPRISLSIEDITARVGAGETRARLAAIVENSDDAIIGKNLDGIITSWNRGAQRLFGYTAQEIVGQSVLTLIPRERHGEEEIILGHVRRGEPVEHFETVRQRKDGTHFHVSLTASPIVDEAGKIVGASKIARDITARKQSEDALRESEQRFRAIADTIPQLAWLANAEPRLVWFNKVWLDYTGTTLEDNVGEGWKRVHHPDHIVAVAEKFERALREGQDWEDTFPLRRHDGEFRWMLSRMKVIRDDAGNVVRFFGTNTDITELRATEEALRLSEQRFRTAVSIVSSLIWTNNAEGKMAGEQPGWGNFTGQTREEYQDYGWARAVHPEDAQPTIDAWNQAVAEKRMFVFEHRVRRADGAWRRCSIRAVPMLGEDGTILEWVGVHTDITERQQAEAALREGNRRLDLLAQTGQELILGGTDSAGLLQTVIERVCANLGVELAFTFLPGDEPETLRLAATAGVDQAGRDFYATIRFGEYLCGQVAERRERLVIENLLECGSPEAAALCTAGVRTYAGFPLLAHGRLHGTMAFASTTRDRFRPEELVLIQTVSDQMAATLDRARTAEALRASEARATGIIQSIADGFMTLDLEWRVTFLSARGAEILAPLQKTTTNVLGKNFFEEFPATVGTIIGESYHRAMREQVTVRFESFYAPLNRWFEIRAYPSPLGLTIYFLDITERQRAQEALRLSEQALAEQADALRQADRSKDEFLAMLAHELRNPLAPLRNAAELLKAEQVSEEERGQAQRIIGRQIENMSRMLDDLLDVSRITEGKIELRKKPVALEAVLTAAASLIRSTCAAHHQELAVSLPNEPVYLHADATRLEQVFGNLLSNACKYSGEGCHIALSAEVSDKSDRSDRSDSGQRLVVVRVTDDGAGIAPEILPHIFDLFVQASRTLDRTHGGLGIGLTLVQRLVKLHGGSIEARSDGLGCGAEFTVRLPILAEAPPAPAPTPPPAQETPRRILIVDDNTDSARSLAALQKRRGHETRTAFTGPEAVAAAAEFLPDVVLLDIGLPGMDGFEVARQIRAMPALGKVFIIAMSGYGRDEDRAEAKAAGFDEYMVKPVDLDQLRAWLRGERGAPP